MYYLCYSLSEIPDSVAAYSKRSSTSTLKELNVSTNHQTKYHDLLRQCQGAADAAGWLKNLQDTLGFLDCRHLAVYNWDNDIENIPVAHDAVRQLLQNRS